MKFVSCCLLSVICLWSSSSVHAAQNDAIHECGNLHSLEFKNIPNADGLYSNENCMLKCSIGNATLSNDAINEGFPCPLDINGVCHDGLCIGTQNDALRECGNLLHIDFRKSPSRGTTYLNDQCTLRCTVGGNVIKESPINEGYQCPLDPTGICRSGKCDKSISPASQATTVQPTTRALQQSLFLTHKIDQINMTIPSADMTKAYTSMVAISCFDGNKNTITFSSPMTVLSQCKKVCQTEQMNGHASRQLWHETPCVVTDSFTDQDHVFIEVTEYGLNFLAQHWAGSINLHIFNLINFNFHKSGLNLPSDQLNFRFADKYEIYRNSAVVGKMDIKFEVKLSRKN